ncbi:MAG: hypothetical protein GXP31_03555 [Kiritimatiellaeota bacterium]|nr:hypothetical protein [Kiritimatiellota bacterium]
MFGTGGLSVHARAGTTVTAGRPPFVSLVWGSCLAVGLANAAVPVEKAVRTPAGTARELIADRHFRRGFILLNPKAGRVVKVAELRWAGAGPGPPVWRLAQWNSRYSLAGVAPEQPASGVVRFANKAKEVMVAVPGRPEADLTLTVNGSAEYAGRPRRKGQPWPHLLVSQRFADPPRVAELSEARFRVSARLLFSRLQKTPDFTPRLHAAQFLVFLTIQNLNRRSAGYGDFLYLGIPLYDSRYPTPRRFTAPDQAGKFIYTPDGTVYTRRRLADGKWVSIDKDVLPIIRSGLREAWRRGFLAASHDLVDYRIAGMNLGWEVPGIYDVGARVRDLSLTVFSADPRPVASDRND